MAKEISLLGFSYSHISARRYPEFKGKLEISPNIHILSIDKHEISMMKQDAIKVTFSFKITYKELADIQLDGDMILKVDSKTLKEVLKGWKDKAIDPETQTIILNLIMQRASIRAIELEEEMGLPIHVRIPRLAVSKKE